MVEDIATLLGQANVSWSQIGPSDQTKPIVHADNLLHLAARRKNIERFLFIFKIKC